jgi:hypothetical protein
MFFEAIDKPVLLWPRPLSAIQSHFDRPAEDFIVVDTDYDHELSKLAKLRRGTPIFDPFPSYGQHYRQFIDQITAAGCAYHIRGLDACRDVLQTLKDPSLARSTIDEILLALGYIELDQAKG